MEQVLPSAGELDLPGLENVGSIGDAEGPQCVLLDQQDRGPVAMDLRDGRENLVHHLRRKPERRLIEQQQLRPGQEAACDRQQLALAAGQRARPQGAALAQDRKATHDRLDLPTRGHPVGPRPGRELEVLEHRLPAEDLAALGHLHQSPRDDRRRLGVGQVEVAEHRRP